MALLHDDVTNAVAANSIHQQWGVARRREPNDAPLAIMINHVVFACHDDGGRVAICLDPRRRLDRGIVKVVIPYFCVEIRDSKFHLPMQANQARDDDASAQQRLPRGDRSLVEWRRPVK